MFAKSFRIISDNIAIYAVFVVLMLVVTAVQDLGIVKSSSNAGTFVVWLILARFVHRAALFDVKFGAKNPDGTADKSYFGFMLRATALTLLSLAITVPLVIWALASSSSSDLRDPAFVSKALLPMLAAMLLVYSILLSIAGTWLPAAVYQENTSIGAALARGMKTFLPIFVRVAPTLAIALVLQMTIIIIAMQFGLSLAVVVAAKPNIPGILTDAVITIIECISITLISVTLSHYYLKAEGKEAAPPAPPMAPSASAVTPTRRTTFGRRT